MSRASRFLAALDASLSPTPERLAHGSVRRALEQVADSNGGVGLPWQAETLLERMEARGEIGVGQRMAGEEFQRLFRMAAIDPLQCPLSGLGRVPGSGLPHPAEAAQRRLSAAVDALGGWGTPIGTACWHLLGYELSLAEYCRRAGWSARPLSTVAAKRVLAGALAVLAQHWRF